MNERARGPLHALALGRESENESMSCGIVRRREPEPRAIGRKLREKRDVLLQFFLRRQEIGVPTAAKRLDQGDAGEEQVLAGRQESLLVAQQYYFALHHRGVRDRAGAELIDKDIDRPALVLDRFLLKDELLL